MQRFMNRGGIGFAASLILGSTVPAYGQASIVGREFRSISKIIARPTIGVAGRDLIAVGAQPLAQALAAKVPPTADELSKILADIVKKEATSGPKPLAKFDLSTGKLEVNKTFNLRGLEVKVGEFDLYSWAKKAGELLASCNPSNLAEHAFTRCIALAAAGTAAAKEDEITKDF
jgi:hypothetical protein